MNNPKISLVAALSENRAIGKDNKLLWHIPEDMKHFREITKGHVVIMGRKTFESIGRLLPQRINIIVSRDINYRVEAATVVHSLQQAIDIAKNYERTEIMIIGGGQIYAEAISFADVLHLTIVQKKIEGDTYFPDYSEFKTVLHKEEGESNGYNFTFLDLGR